MAEKDDDRLVLKENTERYRTDFSLCLVCQQNTAEDLVQRTTNESTDRLISVIETRANYGDTVYHGRRCQGAQGARAPPLFCNVCLGPLSY